MVLMRKSCSTQKVCCNKINTSWREIDPDPVKYEIKIDELVLQDAAQVIVLVAGGGKPPSLFQTMYAYMESPYKDKQEVFELKYVITYSFDSFIYREGIDAGE